MPAAKSSMQSPQPLQTVSATRTNRPAAADWFLCLVIALILGVAYGQTLAPGITWANSGADSGDLVAATVTMGVAHPSGYPSYLLLAGLFQGLPSGDPALRSNLFALCCALLAILVLYAVLRLLLPATDWSARFAAALAALSLGLAPLVWSQAVIAEVHSLNALLSTLLLCGTLIILRTKGNAGNGMFWGQGLLAGFALGNHLTIGILLACCLPASTLSMQAERRLPAGTAQLLGLSVGLLVYLYLPLRAATGPAINWGNPVDWSGFWWVVSGRPYRDLVFGLPAEFLPQRIGAWAALLLQQFGVIGMMLGIGGLLYGKARWPAFVWLALLPAAAGYSLFALAYDSGDSHAYLIPFYLLFAIWIGMGIQALLAALLRQQPKLAIVAALGLVLALGWPVAATAAQVDASEDRRAIRYADEVLQSAPAEALLVTRGDLDTFPLWYYHAALGQRSDLAVIVEPLLAYAWYRDHLAQQYPLLAGIEPGGGEELPALAEANPGRPFCRVELIEFAPRLDCAE